MERAERILSFIHEELLVDEDVEITEETSLFQDRVLNSVSLVTLIEFLEKTFDIKIKTSEVIIENLDSVKNMMAFLDRKISA